MSLNKYGPGKQTIIGDNVNVGAATVYDGTLELDGTWPGEASTVEGYGNPQLLLTQAPLCPQYTVSISGEHIGDPTCTFGGAGLTASSNVDTAKTWEDAVRDRVTGSINVFWNGSRFGTNTFPSSYCFDIGTLEDLQARGHALGLNASQYHLLPDTKLIVMEEWGECANDTDFNDLYWVVTVTEVPPPVSPCTNPDPGQCSNSLPNVDPQTMSSYVTANDLLSGGGGCPCSGSSTPTRTYDSRLADTDFGGGYGQVPNQVPYALKTTADNGQTWTISFVTGAMCGSSFTTTTDTGSNYTPQYGSQDMLLHTGGQYVLTKSDGTVITFNDCD